jgi:hypothetical protein
MGTVADSWPHLKDGAIKLGHQRLSDMHHLITTCVSQFHDDASAQVENLSGPSEEGLGLDLFKALTDVLFVFFPETMIVEKIAREAIKGFRDTMIAGINQAGAASAAGRLAQAKDELRRVLNDLAYATRSNAEAGWRDGVAKLPESLQGFIDASPQYHHLPYDENAHAMEGWLCDSIGIRDAAVANPTPQMIEALWASFNRNVGRVSGRLKWNGMNFVEKYQWLHPVERQQRDHFLTNMGENVYWWELGLTWTERSLDEKRVFIDGFEHDFERQMFVQMIGIDLQTLRQMFEEATGH